MHIATRIGIVLSLCTSPAWASVQAGPFVNPANGHSYYLLNPASWTASEAEAITLGGHLATINNQAENDYLFTQFAPHVPQSNHDLWIGLNDAAVEGTFVWSSGEPVTYTHWGPGEPNNDPGWGGEDYTAYVLHAFGSVVAKDWNDENVTASDRTNHAVVEVVPEPSSAAVLALAAGCVALGRRRRSLAVPLSRFAQPHPGMRCRFPAALVFLLAPAAASAVPTQWPVNGHYYDMVTPANGITWTNANAAASASTFNGHPGHLVTFGDAAEWNFVYSTFPHNFTWIGFSDAQTEGQFRWVTGEPVVFTAWLNNEPNNAASGPGEDYAWYENRGGMPGWNDYRDVAKPTGLDAPIYYVVEYVPEPATLAALSLLAGASMRRSRPRR